MATLLVRKLLCNPSTKLVVVTTINAPIGIGKKEVTIPKLYYAQHPKFGMFE